MNKKNNLIKVESTKPISPHSKALLLAGEEVLKGSISTTRDFCRSMISISLSSIPVYIGTLKVFTNESESLHDTFGKLWVVPVIISLFAVCAFTAGYLPEKRLISLDLPEDIEFFIQKVSTRRFYWGIIGFALLIVSIALSVFILSVA